MNYTSQGTISMQCDIGFRGAVKKTTVFFVPDHSYSIKHRKETRAVFVSEDGHTAIIKKCNPGTGNGVKLSAGIHVSGLISSAVVHQTKVEVQVKKENLQITRITVPAK